jgi:hypothetical protein
MKKLILAMALSAPLSAQAGEFEATERMFLTVMDMCKQRQLNIINTEKMLSRHNITANQLADKFKGNPHNKSVLIATGKAIDERKALSSYYRYCVTDIINSVDDLSKLDPVKMQDEINKIALGVFDKI